MRVINLEQLKAVLGSLPTNPRVVASGNFATPTVLLGAFDEVVPEYRLHMWHAICSAFRHGIPIDAIVFPK